uniref:Cytochrome b n=1 Tax=Candidatus Kentrum sp. MB TaxID=2138164 RepID=A0A451B8U4_9GAMM|nr:MAG: ubiquinol-cytochrome c reductase cytochrome b subunit [Candidatus Kentron sp. MB]VFK29180.1 MAG: ubiquinol-cytochrome c reductase cytochrome b subunit [Candidatus Kentron sp. MB]VFK74708.1 MAG: ubiquinol-cytochrome c reductase cytochrome b subunit [Candidatus Kentron sp. MB]
MKNSLNRLVAWTDVRFPLTKLWNEHLAEYYAPKNFNFWYFFGSLALLVLVIQILTGIWLTMNYKPDAELAFASVEFIMRDVEWGWLIRYLHSTGASAFFVVIYLHMFRGLMYGSYKQPRELLWLIGMVIYLALMAEAFMGYLLPWGQMSYWGAQVIVSLFGAIPFVGEDLALWIRGDYVVSDATLNRFFALHVIALPILLLGLVVVHIMALHETGSNNPDGVEIKKNKNAQGVPVDGIPFHPYYTVKDIVGVVAFLFLFLAVVFFLPEMGGWFLEKDNFVPANPLKTPEHIVPLWYFTPFYAILRAIPDKLIGVLAMGISIVVLFLLPWIDRHPVKSIRYRSVLYKGLLALFVVTFIVLGWLGTQPAVPVLSELGMRLSELYFGFFVILWLYSKDRSSGVHIGVLVAVMAVIVLADIIRFSPDNATLILVSILIPVVYFCTFILGAIYTTNLNSSKLVPDRLVK